MIRRYYTEPKKPKPAKRIKTFQRKHKINLPEMAQWYAEEYERKHG